MTRCFCAVHVFLWHKASWRCTPADQRAMAVTAFGKFSAGTTEQKRDQIETVMQFQELYKEKCAPNVAASLDFSFWRYREMLAPTTLTQRVGQALDNGYT